MGRLKEGKAAGEYRITNEVWKFGGEEIREWVWEFCIWRGEGWTEMDERDSRTDSQEGRGDS